MALKRMILVLAGVMLVAGCAGQQKSTQKQEARNRWNNARASVLANLAKQQYENGNFDDCQKSLNEALSLEPKNPSIHLLQARLYVEQGLLEPAEKTLQTVMSLDPKNAEADYLAGVIYQRWQRPEAALQSYAQACDKQPNELAFVMARAEMLVTMGRLPEALAMLREKMVYFENSAAIRDAVGQLLVQQGSYREASQILRQAGNLAPDEMGIREHAALAMFYAKDYREASQLLDRLVSHEKFASRVDLLMTLGECHVQLGNLREARDSFEKVSELDSSSSVAWLGLAKVSLEMKDTKRCEWSVKRAISLEPQNPEAHVLLGYLRLKQDKLDEALASFRKASAIDTADTISLCMSGYVLEKQGKATEAIKYYLRALQVRPGDELASGLMAQVDVRE